MISRLVFAERATFQPWIDRTSTLEEPGFLQEVNPRYFLPGRSDWTDSRQFCIAGKLPLLLREGAGGEQSSAGSHSTHAIERHIPSLFDPLETGLPGWKPGAARPRHEFVGLPGRPAVHGPCQHVRRQPHAHFRTPETSRIRFWSQRPYSVPEQNRPCVCGHAHLPSAKCRQHGRDLLHTSIRSRPYFSSQSPGKSDTANHRTAGPSPVPHPLDWNSGRAGLRYAQHDVSCAEMLRQTDYTRSSINIAKKTKAASSVQMRSFSPTRL